MSIASTARKRHRVPVSPTGKEESPMMRIPSVLIAAASSLRRVSRPARTNQRSPQRSPTRAQPTKRLSAPATPILRKPPLRRTSTSAPRFTWTTRLYSRRRSRGDRQGQHPQILRANGSRAPLQFAFSNVTVDVARSGDLAEDRGSVQVTTADKKGKPVTQTSELRPRLEKAAGWIMEGRRRH